jgi:diacylglycerol kinase family enzyme
MDVGAVDVQFTWSDEASVRITLVYNPAAGDEQHDGDDLLEELVSAGYDARLVAGKKKLERKLEKVLEDPGELVVVAAGDGGVRRVALALAGRAIPMAILPTGTANNIAKSLGVSGAVSELVAGWPRANRRKLRIGIVSAAGGAMRFVESTGIGLFAELITRGREEAHENAAGLTGNPIDRALGLLQRIVSDRAPEFRRLVLDGTDLSAEYLMVEAMNLPLAGPNVQLAPGADLGDDLLDLVTVSVRERRVVEEYLRARLAGEAAPLELPIRRCRRIQLGAALDELHVDDGAWEAEEDGATTRAGEAPTGAVTIALGARSVEVLVPARSDPGGT